jgi:hypothetical protein
MAPGDSTGGRLSGDSMRKIAFLLVSTMIVTAPSLAFAKKYRHHHRHHATAAAMAAPAAMPMVCCEDTAKMFQTGADAFKTPNMPK